MQIDRKGFFSYGEVRIDERFLTKGKSGAATIGVGVET